MSAQLKAFQGPDVQLLLDRIRTELGPGAKIDGAERIRVGGVMGFFSKEHYRVVVEVPEAPGEPGSPAPPWPDTPLPESPAAAGPTIIPEPWPDAAVASDNGVSHGRDFSDGHGASVGHEQSDLAPDRLDDAWAVAAEGSETDIDVASAHTAPSVAVPVTATSPSPSPSPSLSPLPFVDSDGDTAEAGDGHTTPPPAAARSIGPSSGPHGLVADALRRAGLGDTWAESVSEGLRRGDDLRSLLLQIFADLPCAPPVPGRAGSLLVVAGDGVCARRLAAALADEIGADPTAVPVASRQSGAHVLATGKLLVRSAEDAAELAPTWLRHHAAVVVVDAPVTSTERSWAGDMIATLRPTAVWGVVDATCKTEDVAEWARSLGGIDALALENFDLTASPAAALGAGIPVARVDGQPATAFRWVASVMDRVNSCA